MREVLSETIVQRPLPAGEAREPHLTARPWEDRPDLRVSDRVRAAFHLAALADRDSLPRIRALVAPSAEADRVTLERAIELLRE